MKYLYYDLGEQQQDSCVVAHLRGSAANVILLDPLNFDCYRFGRPFLYRGGLYTHTPARLEIPQDGRWYLVIDCGGYQHHVHPVNVEILTPDESPSASEARRDARRSERITVGDAGDQERAESLSSEVEAAADQPVVRG